jgi:hypothetical protein
MVKSFDQLFDDNWLCIVNIAPRFIMFTHLFRGGTLMTTSPSHENVQKIDSKTWMRIEAHDYKWYLQEHHDTKKHDKGIT